MNLSDSFSQTLAPNDQTLTVANASKLNASSTSSLWQKICFWKPAFHLSEQQMQLIETKKIQPLGKIRKFEAVDLTEKVRENEPKGIEEHPTLENIRDFTHEFVGMAIDAVHDVYISPLINEETSEKIIQSLKKGADWIVGIGNSAAQPMLEMFSQYDQSKEVEVSLKQLLNRLKKDISPNAFKNDLILKINQDPKLKGKQLDLYLDKVQKWIFKTDYSSPLREMFSKDQDPDVISDIFEKAISLLIEKHIDNLKIRLENIFKDFSLREALKKSAQNLTTPFLKKILGLMPKLDGQKYKEIFDEIFSIVDDHAKRYAEADLLSKKFLENHKIMVKEAKQIIKAAKQKQLKTSLTFEERRDKKRCKKYLNEIRQQGGLEGVQRKHFLENFAKSGGLALQGDKSPLKAIAAQIIEFIIPSKVINENGEILSPDALEELFSQQELLKQIEIPVELTKLLEEAKEIAQEFLPKDVVESVDKFDHSFHSLVKDIAVDIGRTGIEWGIGQALDVLLQKIANPEKLDALMTESILPAAVKEMILVFIQQLTIGQINKLSLAFAAFLNSENLQSIEEIQDLLFHMFKKESVQFSVNEKLTKEQFNEMTAPFIHKLLNVLDILKIERGTEEGAIKPHEVEAVIAKFFSETPAKDEELNPVYADLILNLGFKIGEFGKGTERILSFKSVKNQIVSSIVKGIRDYRSSPYKLLDTAINSARETQLKEEKIKELVTIEYTVDELDEKIVHLKAEQAGIELRQSALELEGKDGTPEFDRCNLEYETCRKQINELVVKQVQAQAALDSLPEKRANVQNDLKRNFLTISQLGHDMVMFQAGQAAGLFGKFAAKKILGSDASHLFNVIEKIYQRFTCSEYMNRHLILKVVNVAANGLDEISRKEKSQTQHQTSLLEPHQKVAEQTNTLFSKKNPRTFWQKIGRFVRSIFKFLRMTPSIEIKLSVRQLRLIDSLNPHTPGKLIQPQKSEAGKNIENSITNQEAGKEEENIIHKDFDDSLMLMQKVVKKITKRVTKEINQTKVPEIIGKIQQGVKLVTEHVKPIVDTLITIGDPISKALLKKIEEQKYDLPLDQAFKNVLKKLHEGDSEDLLKKLEEKLYASLAGKKYLSWFQGPKDYVEPVMRWLKNPEPTALIKEFSENKKFDESLIKLVSTEALRFLVQHNIDKVNRSLQKLVQDDLPIIIPNMIKINGLNIGKILSERLAEVIMGMGDGTYTKLLDGLVTQINDQAESFYKEEMQLKKEKLDIDLSELDPDDALKFLSHSTIENMVKNEDPKKPIWHQVIYDICHRPKEVEEDHHLIYKSSQEELFYNNISERLLALMLPPKIITVGKENFEVDGLTYLWKQIQLDNKLQEHIQHAKELLEWALPESLIQKSNEFEKSFLQLVEKFAVPYLKTFITRQLANAIKGGVELLTDPETFDALLATDILPSIHEVIVQGFIVKMISTSDEELADYFRLIIDFDDPEELRETLAENLYGLIHKTNDFQKNFEARNKGQFWWDKGDVDIEKFKEAYLPGIIEEMERCFIAKGILSSKNKIASYFNQLINQENPDAIEKIYDLLFKQSKMQCNFNCSDKKAKERFIQLSKPFVLDIQNMLISVKKSPEKGGVITEKEIASLIQNFLNPEDYEAPDYAKLITNLLKIGEFGSWISWFLDFQWSQKNLIGAKILPAIYKYRTSHRALLLSGMKALERSLSQEKISTLLKPKPSVKEATLKNEALLKNRNELNSKLEKMDPSDHKFQQYQIDIKELESKLEACKLEIDAAKKYELAMSREKANQANALESEMEILARETHDFLTYNMQVQNLEWGWKKAVKDHTVLKNVMEKFKKKFLTLESELLFKNILFNAFDYTVTTLETTSDKLNAESVSKTL